MRTRSTTAVAVIGLLAAACDAGNPEAPADRAAPPPAGVAGTQGGTLAEAFAPHIDHLVDGIEPLPWSDGVPLETIAALEPDLVFAPSEEDAALLAEIAPTVPRGAWNGSWKQDLRYVAAVLGRSSDAEALLAAFEERTADLRTRLARLRAGTTVAAAQIF